MVTSVVDLRRARYLALTACVGNCLTAARLVVGSSHG